MTASILTAGILTVYKNRATGRNICHMITVNIEDTRYQINLTSSYFV